LHRIEKKYGKEVAEFLIDLRRELGSQTAVAEDLKEPAVEEMAWHPIGPRYGLRGLSV